MNPSATQSPAQARTHYKATHCLLCGSADLSLAFRFHVSMLGSLGISADLLQWSDEELAVGAEQIALYKQIRPLVQLGEQYRLLPAQGQAFTAWQYMSEDKGEGVLFAFRTHLPEPVIPPPVYLQGLERQAVYTVEGYSEARSGLAWMNLGLAVGLGNFESTVRRIRRVG